MKGKAGLIVGLGAGYVLGTRDGRGRYEQIRQQWQRLVNDPRVRETAAQATDLAKEKAPLVKGKVSDVASRAGSKVGGSDSGVSTGSGLDDLDGSGTSNTGGFHSTDGLDSTDSVGSSDGIATDDVLEEDAIILTPPSPSPLAPGPTDTSSGSGSHG
jgi:hypothetical protein